MRKKRKEDPILIGLKPREEFYLHGDRHIVLVRYDKTSIEVMRIKDQKRMRLDGNSKIVPIPNI
jgi:hypothetical protein